MQLTTFVTIWQNQGHSVLSEDTDIEKESAGRQGTCSLVISSNFSIENLCTKMVLPLYGMQKQIMRWTFLWKASGSPPLFQCLLFTWRHSELVSKAKQSHKSNRIGGFEGSQSTCSQGSTRFLLSGFQCGGFHILFFCVCGICQPPPIFPLVAGCT